MLAILQHRSGGPLKLALGIPESPQVNGAENRVRNAVPTEPGSSSPPVFDGDWRLIAMHQHQGSDTSPSAPIYNQAIPMKTATWN